MEEKMLQYFASEEHMLIFALVYTDTSLRAKLLGITEELYENEEEAKQWRNKIVKKIHPDHCHIDGADAAVRKLMEFYKSMTADDCDSEEQSEDKDCKSGDTDEQE